jgi:hypothetical protein
MGVDAWSDWAGRAPQAPPVIPPVPAAGPAEDDLYDLVLTRASRLVGAGDALLWLVDDDGQRLVVGAGTGRFSTPSAGASAGGKGWPARSGRPARRGP